jgi:hypothetical protein
MLYRGRYAVCQVKKRSWIPKVLTWVFDLVAILILIYCAI